MTNNDPKESDLMASKTNGAKTFVRTCTYIGTDGGICGAYLRSGSRMDKCDAHDRISRGIHQIWVADPNAERVGRQWRAIIDQQRQLSPVSA